MSVLVNNFIESARRWWAYEFLGLLLILMSLLVIGHPIASYAGLVFYFAATFVVSGILRIVTSYASRDVLYHWGWYAAGGVVDMVIGFLLLMRLDIAAVALSVYVGFFILFGSMAAIFRASELRTFGFQGWGWPLFAGIAGVIFAFLMLTNLAFGAETIVLWTALGFLMMGIFYIYLGVHLRRIGKDINQRVPQDGIRI